MLRACRFLGSSPAPQDDKLSGSTQEPAFYTSIRAHRNPGKFENNRFTSSTSWDSLLAGTQHRGGRWAVHQPSLVLSFGPAPLLSADWWRRAALELIGRQRAAGGDCKFGCSRVLNLSSEELPRQPRTGSLWRWHRRCPRAESITLSPNPSFLYFVFIPPSLPSPSSPRRLALDPVQASVKVRTRAATAAERCALKWPLP